MYKSIIILIVAVLFLYESSSLSGENKKSQTVASAKFKSEVFPIWPDGNPDGWIEKHKEESTQKGDVVRIKYINTPTLKHYFPNSDNLKKKGVIICPGGGYSILAYNIEGEVIADFLADAGYHAFVLKYRLPRRGLDKIRYKAALQDTQRALSIVNSRKKEFNIGKVGIMGFSAGGHLSAVTACRSGKRTYSAVDTADKFSCRPDFAALIYPAYLVTNLNAGTLAAELSIPDNMPPVFLIQTEDDGIHVENALFFYLALKKKKIPAEMHIYAEGGHGYAMRKKNKPVGAWPELFLKWLALQ
jgi:acetyl esterase/lipase